MVWAKGLPEREKRGCSSCRKRDDDSAPWRNHLPSLANYVIAYVKCAHALRATGRKGQLLTLRLWADWTTVDVSVCLCRTSNVSGGNDVTYRPVLHTLRYLICNTPSGLRSVFSALRHSRLCCRDSPFFSCFCTLRRALRRPHTVLFFFQLLFFSRSGAVNSAFVGLLPCRALLFPVPSVSASRVYNRRSSPLPSVICCCQLVDVLSFTFLLLPFLLSFDVCYQQRYLDYNSSSQEIYNTDIQ